MARKSKASRTRRRSRRSSRRRSFGGSGGGARRGFALYPSGAMTAAAYTAGGFILANLAANYLGGPKSASDPTPRFGMFSQGWGRIGGKALAAGAAFMLAKRFAPAPIATGLAVGGLTSVALDVFNRFMNPPAATSGVAGLGIGDPSGISYFQPPLQFAPAYTASPQYADAIA